MRKLLYVFSLLPAMSFAADSVAVEAVNYSVSAGFNHVAEIGDLVDISGNVRGGITDYLGYGLSGAVEKSNGADYVADHDAYRLGAQLFARDRRIGYIGLSYTYLNLKPDWPDGLNWTNTPSDSIDISSYGVFAGYYLNRLTLSGGRFRTDTESSKKDYSSNVGAAYYLTDDVQINASVQGSGIDSNSAYGVGLAFQPGLFKRAVAVELGWLDSKNTKPDFAVRINYYFDTRVSLLDRDRKY